MLSGLPVISLGMYLRTIARRNKDGSTVRYLQLAHNEWDPQRRCAVARVVHSFGREDELDRAALARLVRSIARFLEPAEALAVMAPRELRFLGSKALGGAWVLDALWRRLGIDAMLAGLLTGRRLDPAAERLLFGLVCNRALAPASKLACAEWLQGEVAIPDLPELGGDPQPLYRSMDFLLEVESELAEAVYWEVADLLNLEVDLILFDTTSTYFEIDEPDAPPARSESGGDAAAAAVDESEDSEESAVGFRSRGHSKDHRPDLPQIVIGLAVTRSGIPIRVWSWPGNTSDQALIRQVKDELRAWKLTRVVWVADRGFSSARNRRYLQRAGGHYILGEKLRSGSKEARAALARQGRYHPVAGNLRVKEVVVDDATMRDRFVVCHNPEQAERDKLVREQILVQLQAEIAGSDALPEQTRHDLACRLEAKPGYRRFVRQTRAGLLRIDRAAVAAEQRLDGKFLLRTSDPTLSAEDVALGYKQLLEVEQAWRDMKTTLDLRPVFHRKEQRIRAHVLLCWLALLLIRVAETTTGKTWRTLRRELQRMHLGEFEGSAGRVLQRSETTAAQRQILHALTIDEPPRFSELEPAQAAA
ncbi:MAG TPA: IS1634 family transposase [Burkholderiales bacterium]|nr:IS1634 family transposase [Burkholderiales bacterium]